MSLRYALSRTHSVGPPTAQLEPRQARKGATVEKSGCGGPSQLRVVTPALRPKVQHLPDSSRQPRPLRTRALKLGLAAGAPLTLLALQHFGLLRGFSNPSNAASTLLGYGRWGYALFVAAYALLQPFGVPGTLFIVAAPLVWPWPVAFALSMVGTMAASVIGFSFARFVARDWLSAHVPARFRAYDRALAERAFSTVFFLRLVFWMPQLLHTFLGVSRVPFWTHFWASLAGYVIPLLLVSYFGARLFEALRRAPPALWFALGLGLCSVALSVWWWRRRRARTAL